MIELTLSNQCSAETLDTSNSGKWASNLNLKVILLRSLGEHLRRPSERPGPIMPIPSVFSIPALPLRKLTSQDMERGQ